MNAIPATAARRRPDTSSTRLHGLDALRAGALLLGILLHALMPFIDGLSPDGLSWLVVDRESSAWAGPTVTIIHLFRMVLFFALAGYFARVSLRRRGTRSFVKDRAVRIWLPLVAFWPLAVVPLAVIAGAWMEAHDRPLPPAPDSWLAVFAPGQLWFLWVLVECYIVAMVVRALALRIAPRWTTRLADRFSFLLSGPAAVPVLAIPYAVAVLWQGGRAGIAEPRTIVPEPAGLLAYLAAFVAGWLLCRDPAALGRIARSRFVLLAAAIAGSGLVLYLTGQLGEGPDQAATSVAVLTVVVASLTAWAWAYALLGLCVVYLDTERPVVRYLADASYWMYLMHLPLILALEAPLSDLTWPVAVKLVVVLGVGTALLLLSYDLFVRSTWIGAWLNGRRRPRALFRVVPRRS